MNRVITEYFFMIFCWTLVFSENSKFRPRIVGRKRNSLGLFRRRRLFNVDLWLGLLRSGSTRSGLIDPRDPQSATGRFIDFDYCAPQPDLSGSDRKPCRQSCNEAVHER